LLQSYLRWGIIRLSTGTPEPFVFATTISSTEMKRRATKTEDRSKSSAKARLAASRPEEESEQAKKRRTELKKVG
jgi:guanylate kinase